MKAFVAHFYGWSDNEVSRMRYKLFLDYYKAAKIIKAEDALHDYTASMYVNFKKDAQKRVWTEARKDIVKYQERPDSEKNKTSNIQRIIEAQGNG